ncbi:MAG: ferrous iron transport protein A [Bacteroidia bacterium]
MKQSARNLSELEVGEHAIIDSFTDPVMSLKLLEMGCTPGETVQLVKVAPMGDPIAISVSGYLLSMRKAEASTVLIHVIAP